MQGINQRIEWASPRVALSVNYFDDSHDCQSSGGKGASRLALSMLSKASFVISRTRIMRPFPMTLWSDLRKYCGSRLSEPTNFRPSKANISAGCKAIQCSPPIGAIVTTDSAFGLRDVFLNDSNADWAAPPKGPRS